MSLSEILNSRYSVRAFKKDPVEQSILEEVFTAAQRAPSNCNVQPWQTYVVSGAKKDQLKNLLIGTVMKQQQPEPDFNWKVAYEGIHRERQFGSANALYSSMGIAREDKMKRNMAMLRNWAFFDAPHVAFFTMDTYLDIMGAVDVGIYAQTLTLLLKERGIDSCMQGALGQFPQPVHEFLELPQGRGVLFGMSFGYADENADANKTRTDRAALQDAVTFVS
ncbi:MULTISPECIES: nitroreductase family protein [Thalassolituus]|jgi:nitroreductase|uniref:nitroreductase family protein n=1 Tax=Thalassolituus TaxID=187492 RepID=UPI001CE26204|nr:MULTISPECIES: nitroreductase family protein [Thalassolituus]MCA6058188.1 nitroreductase family protein [Thalassolituus sp. ST750PaO-4]MCB2386586.1 nitroreductase family protein [Thalassolituus alkanivorans]MCB2424236.1 nitroreductase family protein [Thalassolituus alkanivorans]